MVLVLETANVSCVMCYVESALKSLSLKPISGIRDILLFRIMGYTAVFQYNPALFPGMIPSW